MNWKSILIVVFTICFAHITSGQKTDKKSDKTITITGKVSNQDNKPVGGAVFYIDNLKTSYISKSNGSYKLKISSSANKIMVRSSIFGTGETLINGQTKINFILTGLSGDQALQANGTGIDRVIADTGKKPSRKKATKMNTYNDIYQMIRGEVSGVVVSGKSILIQQGHSFFGSSEPLFVVNGVIVNSIDFISPLEVKSIKVLKGSSAAIYGIRGTNGVISITLLNGSENE